jgi:serine/threonine-protein kinase
MIGRVVGNYRIEEKIGEGGMGAVFRAVDAMLERDVAIKAIRPELGREPQMIERFRAEARILARVNHPAIATIYSFFHEGEEFFLAMEYVRGRSLSRVLETEGALPWRTAVRLLLSALDGIEQAHRAGIVHRDLKPDNLMITEAGTIKVMDFGIARVAGSGHLTRTGLLVGTLRYMAPEQIRGEEVDPRTDVYALGAVLYQMLAGRVPFEGGSDFAILRAQVEETPAPPSAHLPGLPEWADHAVLKALEKDPARRFQSVEEMRSFLSRNAGDLTPVPIAPEGDLPTMVLPVRSTTIPSSPDTIETSRPRVPAGPPTVALPPPPAGSTSYRPVDGSGWKGAAAGAALVLALAAVGLFLWTRPEPEPVVPAQEAAQEPVQQEEPPQTVEATVTAPASAVPPPALPAPRREPVPQTREAEPRPAPVVVPVEDVEVRTEPEPTPAEPEAAPSSTDPEPAAEDPPTEEMRQTASDLLAASHHLVELYEVFLEQKEDGGADLTEADERLQEELEVFVGAAETFNKQFKDGAFARARNRFRSRSEAEARNEMRRRARELAMSGGRVEALMAQVQPSPEVRQSWNEVKRGWQRIARIAGR